MREFRTTLALLVIVLLLGGWIFLRKEWGPIREGFKPIDVNPEDVRELTVKNERAKETIVLKKEKGAWWMDKPRRARADQDFIKSVLDKLKDLTATQDVTEALKGRDLSEYHLKDSPRVLLTVRLQSGASHTLRFGDKTVDSQSVYTQLESGNIVLVDALLFDDLNGRDADGFRDKKLLVFDHNKVNKIALTYPDKVIEIKRTGDFDWKILKPLVTTAETTAVDSLMTKLETLQATRFVDEAPQDLSKYGLDQPQLRVDLWVKGRKAPHTLWIGKEGQGADAQNHYARSSRAQPVVTLASYLVKDLKQDVKTLRSKTVLTIIPNDVKRLTLTYPGQRPIDIEQVSKETTPAWRLKSPVEYPADRQTVDNILFSLNGQVADDFIDRPTALAPYGLEPPRAEVALYIKQDQQPTHVLRIGKKTKDAKGEGVYVQIKGEDTVYKVAGAQWVDKVTLPLEQLRDKQILAFDTAQVESFTVTHGTKTVVVERKDVNHWQIVQPQRTAADFAKVNAFLGLLSDLRGEAFVESLPGDADPATEERLKKYTLDAPALKVVLFLRDKVTKKRQGTQIYVSRKNAQREVYILRRPFEPAVYRAKGNVLDELRVDVKDFK
ncbi:MAG: DUF4340 domain-containing protein [Abditibacteriales bacterium]|nr:DUF4340 domain-containing protein [Abditibacteriales bacterium]MDW8365494.1 DUF4340 domain-containing protein [Abditibacteriales bacterium]